MKRIWFRHLWYVSTGWKFYFRFKLLEPNKLYHSGCFTDNCGLILCDNCRKTKESKNKLREAGYRHIGHIQNYDLYYHIVSDSLMAVRGSYGR